MSTASDFQQRLQQAVALHGQGRNADARAIVLPLLEQFPRQPNLLTLAGLIHKALGEFAAAAGYFRHSLQVTGGQPPVFNSLANTLKAQGDVAGAEQAYRDALAQDGDFHEAWKNLALLLLEAGRPEDALASIERAVELAPRDPRSLTALGNVYLALERYEPAMDAYRRALAFDPQDVHALHNLGLTCRMTDRIDEAIVWLGRAAVQAPKVAEIDYNLGIAWFEQGDHAKTEQALLAAVAKRPEYVDAHQTLNEFYWQSGRSGDFGRSYERAIGERPYDLPLRIAQVRALAHAGREEEALVAIGQAVQRLGAQPSLRALEARLHANRGATDAAASAFERAIRGAPGEIDVRLDYASFLVREGQYTDALVHLDAVSGTQPHHQLMWALRGLCWRLGGDERHAWLNDYQNMVGIYTLPVPVGYTRLEDFLAELAVHLLAMHRTDVHPLRQTLINGTQTPGRLLQRPGRLLELLRAALAVPVQAYIDAMPAVPAHPLYGRKSAGFRFSGSWSVRLRADGFHVNHVHPQGWISSSFYVRLPPSTVAATDPGGSARDGWLKFGESSLVLGDRECIAREVAPRAGQVVLFPSYFWHGTYPFAGTPDDYRLTAPFDAVPA